MNHNKTQCDRIMEWFSRGVAITPLEAWQELGIYRLAARIYQLRKSGHAIGDNWLFLKNRYNEQVKVKEYFLEK